MRAVGYTRVSTAAQATEERVSLDEQRKDIEAHCKSRGYTVTAWYSDVGSGASKRRPKFQQMLQDARDDNFDVIVAWKSDRLSRGLYPATALMEALEGGNITIEAVKDNIDIKSFGIMAAVGKIELENIRERCQMGYRGRISKGKIHSVPKFGYYSDDGLPVVLTEESTVVERIFRDYVTGVACQTIADNLNQESVPTRRGATWNGSRVWSILTCTNYIGEGRYCRVKYLKRDNGERDVKVTKHLSEDSWVTVPYPRIIDDATWRKAKEMRKHPQRKVWDRERKHNVVYLLEGLLWCSHCGKRYRPGASHGVYRWTTKDGVEHRRKSEKLRPRYMCNGGSKMECPRSTMYAQSVEKLVWEAVASFIAEPEQVNALLQARQKDLESGAILENLSKARARLAQVEAERGRRLSQHSKAYITDLELDLALREINERLEYHQEELSRLEAESNQSVKAIEQLQNWVDASRHIATRLETLNVAERAEVVRLIVDRVTVVGQEYQIRMVLDSTGYIPSQQHQSPA